MSKQLTVIDETTGQVRQLVCDADGKLVIVGTVTESAPIDLTTLEGSAADIKTAVEGTLAVQEQSPIVLTTLEGNTALATSGKAIAGNTNATPDTADAVALGVTSKSIYVKNTDTVDAMQVSFDGGTTWFTLAVGDSISLDIVRTTISVKAAVATVAYSVLVTS